MMSDMPAPSSQIDFKSPSEYADAVIIVEDTKLYTPIYYLEKMSPKISMMLTNMQRNEGRYVITLPDLSVATVEALLQYTTPGSKSFDAPLLARAAKYFEIKWLSIMCEKELLSVFESTPSIDKKLDLLLMAQDLNLKKLLDVGVQFFSKMKFQALKKGDQSLKL